MTYCVSSVFILYKILYVFKKRAVPDAIPVTPSGIKNYFFLEVVIPKSAAALGSQPRLPSISYPRV